MSGRTFDLGAILAGLPRDPSKWTKRYVADVIDRANRRIQVLSDRIGDVTKGRVMPDLEQVTIGSGRQFPLAVLFLDICSFSSWPNWTPTEQRTVLAVMNVFMAEMVNVARDFGGTFEKNTGDGLMAYFGEGTSSNQERVKPAVEAALVMHYVNDVYLSPWLLQNRAPAIRFRVGIDVGPVTIARVGLRGQESSIVAIGTPANIACKLMNLLPQGGVCIGNEVYLNLPNNWGHFCRLCSQSSGFVYVTTQMPYPAWELNYRLSAPIL